MPSSVIRTKLKEKNIDSTGSKSEIKKRLQEVEDNLDKMDASCDQNINM